MLTRINRWRTSRELGGDGGIAMVLVIGVSSVLAILIVAAVSFTIGGLKNSRNTQDWSAALAAAYAGVEEYQSRLAGDPTYLRWGNPASAFSGDTVQLPKPAQANPAFALGIDPTAWAVVDGSDPADPAKYRYEVDNSNYSVDGTLRLRSTGLKGGLTRTIVANLKQTGFIDFLYFTDYEIQDPALSGATSDACKLYGFDGRPTADSSLPKEATAPPMQSNPCGNIAFGNGDRINGPMHTNDQLRTCGTTFKGTVTTGWPRTENAYINRDSNHGTSGCSAPVFDLKAQGYPKYSKQVPMPPTNTELRTETRYDLDDSIVQNPGCLYTGPTSIKFHADGRMTVKSPWTIATQVAGNPATSGKAPDLCGKPGPQPGGLASVAGATFPVPDNRVIFVQGKTGVQGDPNRWPSGERPRNDFECKGANGSAGNGIGYPRANEFVDNGTSPYSCEYGDLFVEGELDGHVTLASENYTYITGNLKYHDSQDDILGIVGQNAVLVWNPVTRTSSWNNSYSYDELLSDNRRIDAAILSVAHTFQVQNYSRGNGQGTLTVNGAIAQKYRGIVRTGSSGYAKNYNYDARLQYTAPPKFLSPVTTTYGVNVWIEVDPAFRADGGSS